MGVAYITADGQRLTSFPADLSLVSLINMFSILDRLFNTCPSSRTARSSISTSQAGKARQRVCGHGRDSHRKRRSTSSGSSQLPVSSAPTSELARTATRWSSGHSCVLRVKRVPPLDVTVGAAVSRGKRIHRRGCFEEACLSGHKSIGKTMELDQVDPVVTASSLWNREEAACEA